MATYHAMFFGEKNVLQTKDFIDETKKKKLCTCLYIWMAATQKTFPRINTFGLVMVLSRFLLYIILQLCVQTCIIYHVSWSLCLIDYSKPMKINQLCSPLRNVVLIGSSIEGQHTFCPVLFQYVWLEGLKHGIRIINPWAQLSYVCFDILV